MENPNIELSLEEQVGLAEELSQATERLNRVDVDDAVVSSGDNPQFRDDYEGLEQQAVKNREKLDAGVSDKGALVKHLRELGKEDVAARIERMFELK